MVRKRHKKQSAGTSAPAPQIPPEGMNPITESIDHDFNEEKFENLMIESDQFADEPEFTDLLMNRSKAVQVTERWFRKYEKRLEAAKERSQEDYQLVSDDLHIKIIDELATPAFRKIVFDRLQTLQARLLASHDLDRYKSVLLLTLLLGNEKVPWGICSLILAIYNRTMKETLESFRTENNAFNVLDEVIQSMGIDPADAKDVFESPEKMALLEQKLKTDHPEIFQVAELMTDELLDTFEADLSDGKVALDLFSAEELLLPFRRIREEFGETFGEQAPTQDLQDRSFEIFRESVASIMTPERFQRLRKQVNSIAIAWQRERRKWAEALQVEGSLLDEEEISENRFIFSAFVGQLRRADRQYTSHQKRKKRGR